MPIKELTFHEIVAQIDADGAYRHYAGYLLELLTSDGDDVSECPSEADFIKRMAAGPDGDINELENAAKLLSQSIATVVRLLDSIAPLDSSKALFEGGPTILRALHEFMFKQLYHIGLGTRVLFEASIDFDTHDGVEEYIEYLKQTYGLSDMQCHSLKMEWMDGDANLCSSLLEHDRHLKVFPDDDTCFQVCDAAGDFLLKLPSVFLTSNGLVVSKYYFLARILSILSHLDLMARVISKEKGHTYRKEDVDMRELFELDTLVAVGKAFLTKLN